METVLDRLFAKDKVERVVVEPDARNHKIHVLNARLGFQPAGEVTLPDKQALLSFCTREAFHSRTPSPSFIPDPPGSITVTTAELESVLAAGSTANHLSPERRTAANATTGTAHLTPERWAAANRHLVRKALAEFSHERILSRAELVSTDAGARESAVYRGHAATTAPWSTVLRPGYWSSTTGPSRTCPSAASKRAYPTCPRQGLKDGHVPREPELDALRFITEFRDTLGIREEMLPVYLEEISSTLASHAYKQWMGQPSSAELAAGVTGGADPAADFQAIERSMTEGHPVLRGQQRAAGLRHQRLPRLRPGSRRPRAAGMDRGRTGTRPSSPPVEGLGLPDPPRRRTGDVRRRATLTPSSRAQGLDPAEYFLMPVHPWQWDNKLTVTFAAEIAQQHIVHLGIGADSYQAQQSIRTFFNTVSPQKCYVKTAMSVLNMGFMRGLSPQYMKATPAINDWLHELIRRRRRPAQARTRP